ncbi:hypothetical protein [Actinomadura atramentaria]|uniref:hypothetical protein n=1 Tax=Actinomadura atramentaria TaxID=1990 RepID=UPI00036CC822|nr:hypothetical protein [Actinomadura atramentaria]
MAEDRSPLAPVARFPEKVPTVYERTTAPNRVGGRGPLRFEEGLASDSDIPSDFGVGVMQGYETAPGRSNHNKNVFTKEPGETMRQRAHVGSAAWPEAPTFLSEFGHGAMNDYAEIKYEQVARSGSHYTRQNPAEVQD